MDVGSWLRSLGLSRYEAAFGENSIDANFLRDLREADLAQTGVTLGDRERLRKAIASFSTAECPPRAESFAPARPGAGRRNVVTSDYERNFTVSKVRDRAERAMVSTISATR
jgi:hypothetical protein